MLTMKSSYKQRGFTIVELLIVIVVIAILAAITIVAYNGIQTRASNASRVSEFNQWLKVYELYKVQNGTYPTMPVGGYCLGTGFPDGKCRDYTQDPAQPGSNALSEANSDPLITKAKTVGSIPQAQHVPVNSTVGPYIYYYTNWIEIFVVLKGAASDCPTKDSYVLDGGTGRVLCYVGMPYSS
jgi:prepilin-type N-terminal cleavage/methylation domain-containing protein